MRYNPYAVPWDNLLSYMTPRLNTPRAEAEEASKKWNDLIKDRLGDMPPEQALRPREGTEIDQGFVNSDFYKDYLNYTGPDTADMMRESKYFDRMGSSSGMGRLDAAYDN
jgi:hypothetical protein